MQAGSVCQMCIIIFMDFLRKHHTIYRMAYYGLSHSYVRLCEAQYYNEYTGGMPGNVVSSVCNQVAYNVPYLILLIITAHL